MSRWVYFDVDSTLILSNERPYKKLPLVSILDPITNKLVSKRVHTKHLALLKYFVEHNETVVMWSAAGASWALAVAVALDVEHLVTYFLQKPDCIYDDERPRVWMPVYPRWLDPTK